GPWAKPEGRSQAVTTIPASVARAAAIDRSGRRPTTGANWWAAPRTAVVRKASTPTCTAATAPGWEGAATIRSAANHTASPKAARPTPPAARKPSGTLGGGTVAAAPGMKGAAAGARAAAGPGGGAGW